MATVPVRVKSPRERERLIFTAASIAAALVVVAGFSRTYYLKELFGTPQLSPLVHLHGLLFSSWVVLFIVQAWLVSSRRTRLHMKLGIAGFLLAVTMIIVGTLTAVTAARLGHAPPGAPPPLIFFVIPFFDMVVFTILIAAGFLFRRHTDYHKRIMVVATLGLLTAAFGRLTIIFLGSGKPMLAMAGTTLLLIGIVIWDSHLHRRLHPAFAWAGALLVLSYPTRFLVAQTGAWMHFARWITG
ncbi:MAG TPA: hypothetical protein VN577_10215 [Terriglobales bacterium]|nr:hypothetical protein [Terriglobales bacterium]